MALGRGCGAPLRVDDINLLHGYVVPGGSWPPARLENTAVLHLYMEEVAGFESYGSPAPDHMRSTYLPNHKVGDMHAIGVQLDGVVVTA